MHEHENAALDRLPEEHPPTVDARVFVAGSHAAFRFSYSRARAAELPPNKRSAT